MSCNFMNQPLVAIHCLVYNHEPYLRDCFEGFVKQQTNFPCAILLIQIGYKVTKNIR